MKHTLLKFLFIVICCFTNLGIYCQQYSLIGTDICSDGSQTTTISLSGFDPQKMYAIYRDGKFIKAIYPETTEGKDRGTFGSFKNYGTYTAVEFLRSGNPGDPESGKKINGSVTIFRKPKISLPEKLEIKSGNALKFQPQTDLEGCTFKWNAKLESGKAVGFHKTGQGLICDTLTLQNKNKDTAACIIYSITPISPGRLGSCTGQAVDLIVWITK